MTPAQRQAAAVRAAAADFVPPVAQTEINMLRAKYYAAEQHINNLEYENKRGKPRNTKTALRRLFEDLRVIRKMITKMRAGIRSK